MKFAVITEVPDFPDNGIILTDEHMGNLALEMIIAGMPPQTGAPVQFVPGYARLFELGEILVLEDEYGREIGGGGRKPSKWSVSCEHFDTVEEAIQRATEVLTVGTVQAKEPV